MDKNSMVTKTDARIANAIFLYLFFLALPRAAQFTVTVNPDTLKSSSGTDSVKLVFIAKDSLWYIDFSEQNPRAKSIKNITGKPVTPVLSPDGNYVAYVTGVGGVPPLNSSSPNSTAWIADLTGTSAPQKIADTGWSPRFDLAAAAPTVIFSTCGKTAPGSDTLWKGCGKVKKSVIGAQQLTDLWTGGSLFGGMSYNGEWLCTADNMPPFMLDRTNASNTPVKIHRLNWVNNKTNTDTVFAPQTCNPSISSSRIFFDAMMYLDFGTTTVQGFHAKNLGAWSEHQRIFISRSNNSVARYFKMPAEPPVNSDPQNPGDITNKTWECPRWSNHPYFASAALNIERVSSDGSATIDRKESVYLINIRDSIYTKLVSISDTTANNASLSLEFPWLWVATPQNFETIEDRQWLNRSMDAAVRQRPDILSGQSGYRVFQRHGELYSSQPLIMVEFFSLNGRRIGATAPGLQSSCRIPRNTSMGGVLFARCVFSDHSLASVKLTGF